MSGDISQLTGLGRTLGRIGDEHVGLDNRNRIASGSSNWFGRAVNWIKSSLGLGDGGSGAVMRHVVDTVRNTEGFGDRFAEIAQGRLGSALTSGQPITGRAVSQVISDIVRTKSDEDTVRSETIKLNTRELCESLCDTGDTPFMKALEEQMEFFGVGDRFGDVEYADVLELQGKIQESLERTSLRKGQSPSPGDAQPVIENACREFALGMVKGGIAEHVSSLAGYEGDDSSLMTALQSRAGQAGIEIDAKPGDLAKLAKKFEDKLIVRCLYDRDNLHPPTLDESQKTLNKVLDSFLDGLKLVESREDLTDTQRATVKEAVISAPTLHTAAMVTALCDTAKASEAFASVLTNPLSTTEQLTEAVKTYNGVVNKALYQEYSTHGSLLRDGIGGAPEADAVRLSSTRVGLELAGIKGGKAKETFHALTALACSLTALRYSMRKLDQTDREGVMQKMALSRFLGEIGQRGGVPGAMIDKALGEVGPGGVSIETLRAELGDGVHGMGGVTVGDGFDMDAAIHSFDSDSNHDMALANKSTYELKEGVAPESFRNKTAHFSKGFLTDFFRTGITVDGVYIKGPGSQDFEKMESALDKLINKFPSVEEAGRVTRPLFQSLAASIMVVLGQDGATGEQMAATNLSAGKKLVEAIQFDIKSTGGGKYDVRADMGLQRSDRNSVGKSTDPRSLAARLELSIEGAGTEEPTPVVRVTDFDFVFGRM